MRLGLGRADTREARRAVAAPRAPEAIAEAAPERVRGFLLGSSGSRSSA